MNHDVGTTCGVWASSQVRASTQLASEMPPLPCDEGETTQPNSSVVCAHARHGRSPRGWPSCCGSSAAKVHQVEGTGEDDAKDEQCL